SRSGEGMLSRIWLAVIDGVFTLLFGLTIAVGTAVVLFIGGREGLEGRLPPGNLILGMGYLAQFYLPVQGIRKSVMLMPAALASGERAFALLDETPEVAERPGARPLGRAAGAVCFRDVCFAYNGGEPALRGATFEAPAGARVGIAGPTGAGKTTLASLL